MLAGEGADRVGERGSRGLRRRFPVVEPAGEGVDGGLLRGVVEDELFQFVGEVSVGACRGLGPWSGVGRWFGLGLFRVPVREGFACVDEVICGVF